MSTLHLFGDSFSAQYNPPSGEWQKDGHTVQHLFDKWFDFYKGYSWSEIISEKLGLKFNNYSHAGVGMDFMIHQFFGREGQNALKKGDYVFFVLTHYDRRWAVQKLPFASNLGSLKYDTFRKSLLYKYPKQDHGELYAQMEAAYNYWLYCRDEELEIITYMSYLQMIRHSCDKLGYKLYFIPALVPVQPLSAYNNESLDIITRDLNPFKCSGNLNMISINEFVGKNWDERMETRNYNFDANTNPDWYGVDPRIGHMSIHNHAIFANKLYDSIINHTDLDLENGFKENFIGKKGKTDTQEMWDKNFDVPIKKMYKQVLV